MFVYLLLRRVVWLSFLSLLVGLPLTGDGETSLRRCILQYDQQV